MYVDGDAADGIWPKENEKDAKGGGADECDSTVSYPSKEKGMSL